jgi:hypothetical protein
LNDVVLLISDEELRHRLFSHDDWAEAYPEYAFEEAAEDEDENNERKQHRT